MKPESFLRGAFILTAAGLLVKALGAVYRIPFTRLVGSEGVGLYQMAYPIYATLLALSTSGIPVAISLLVAEQGARQDRAGARDTFLLSLVLLLLLGLSLSLALYLAAPWLAQRVLRDDRAYYPLVSIAPAVLVISLVSAFRGYFQGWQLMWPTALSQVVEQLVRVVTVFWAALTLLPRGVEYATAGAAAGAFTGGCAGLLVLCLIFWRLEKRPGSPGRCAVRRRSAYGILRRLLIFALPVSAGSLVIPLVQTIDTVIIPGRLQALGLSSHQATAVFGQFSGMAGTLVFIPAIFTVSLASSLVPHVASALARGDRTKINRRIATSMRITIILCLPATAGLMLLARPLTGLLFGEPEAGEITAWLAPAAFFSSLQQITSGALQGLGNTWLPVLNLLAGCLVKIICNCCLTLLPSLGIRGAALGSVLGFALACLLNCRALVRLTGYGGPFLYLPRPYLAVTIMGAALPLIYNCCSRLGVLAAISLTVLGGASTYFALLLLLGEVSVLDLRRLLRR